MKKHQEYEREKQKIIKRALTHKQYEREIQKLIKKLKL